MEFVERNLLKEPLSVAELEVLARRVGGIRELVKPTARAEVEALGDADIGRFLAENPNSVRRPIIDTGGVVTLGFTPTVREQLGGGSAEAATTARTRQAARARKSTRQAPRGARTRR